MRAKRILPAGLALGLALAVAQPAAAGDQDSGNPAETAREGIELLVKALEELIQSIPQYEAPVILDNGDILIRRKWPPGKGPEDPEADETKA